MPIHCNDYYTSTRVIKVKFWYAITYQNLPFITLVEV